ncbi:MAG: hypothetical protein K5663_10775 [Clostridiales bacterium]|nr:hypothetical protein [Clostridiales bacterium]
MDSFLRTGSNRRGSVPRIIHFASLDMPLEEKSELVRKEYMRGSKGLIIDGRRYTMQFNEDGIRFFEGNSSFPSASPQLSWQQLTERIGELLEAGVYAQQGILDTAQDQVLREYAETLIYMRRDLLQEIDQTVFGVFQFGAKAFDDEVSDIVHVLMDDEQRDILIQRMNALGQIYAESPDIMRYTTYRPNLVAEAFHRLQMNRREYAAQSGFIPDTYKPFITAEQIDSVLVSGGPYSNSRLSIYSHFLMHPDEHERASYLKDFFGTGGRTPALSYNDTIAVEYDAKGMKILLGRRNEDDTVLLNWTAVARRIDLLIKGDRYLTARDHERMPQYETEQLAQRIAGFYDSLPEGFTSLFPTADRDERQAQIVEALGSDDDTERMLDSMADIFAATSPDERMFEFREKVLSDTRDYAEGTYTLFPVRRDDRQISLMDFFAAQSPDQENTQDTIQDAVQEDEEELPDTEETPIHTGEPELYPGMQFVVNGRSFEIESINAIFNNVSLVDVTFRETTGFPITRVEAYDKVLGWVKAQQERDQQDLAKQTDHGATENASSAPAAPSVERRNYIIPDIDLPNRNAHERYRDNVSAIRLLKQLESENRLATAEEQRVLARYVGWGGIPQVFDENNPDWTNESSELRGLLSEEEYAAARSTTLNAFYTDPVIAREMYACLSRMGLREGNLLEPSCGTGNFMGALPSELSGIHMFGIELDSLTGRIARQLYQKNDIRIQGFEQAELPESFFDCVVGNVPFGNYRVADRKYDRHNFLIHDYFIARSLDLVRPGGVVAVITSSGTMDKQNDSARRYLAERADLLGAVRLPNTAFAGDANTQAVTDILFLQKRDSRAVIIPEWAGVETNSDDITMNRYFLSHPEMILGTPVLRRGRYGMEMTVEPDNELPLRDQLRNALTSIDGQIVRQEITDTDLTEPDESMPADPDVRNFSYANINGKVYYRENSRMMPVSLQQTTHERVMAMINMRNTTQLLLKEQLEDGTDERIVALQRRLSEQYDEFISKYGLISSAVNRRAFSQDSSYCLLASLEILDEDGKLERKADIFTKRTIRKAEPVLSVETASEALALSMGEKAEVDLEYMADLCGKDVEEITEELRGVIFKNPVSGIWETGDSYLSGNVREKLRQATKAAEADSVYGINVEFLKRVQPKDLEASDIEIRLGATWITPNYINDFMHEVFHTPFYYLGRHISANYAEVSGAWFIQGKTLDHSNPTTEMTYGTSRVNAYRLLEDALNLKETKIYDIIHTLDGDIRELNKKETMLAQQKQEMIRSAFREWIFKDMNRRETLCQKYNEWFNSIRPREYDGSHIRFVGMTPEISLMPHQKNAVAHILYGGNTLLAHCVGAGKTFEMIAAGMESIRLGLSQKNLYVVPNHLTEQWGADFLRLYPGASILVATRKDFEPANRKRFCSRIATGSYDAIIIGHSQFEKIPLSRERQVATIQAQIDEITAAIEAVGSRRSENFTVKQMERTRKSLEVRLNRLNNQARKDDVVTFEELGVDKLFVDESHNYKNLFLYTKMQNVAGIQQTDAQKSSDMFMKCRYMDELTGGKGVVFATGTPISNSMVEMYTIMRYLQFDTLQNMGLGHFDAWAATFGDTVTAIELAPEGTGYRAKTRFARFFNLPELISVFKEAADVQTPDMLKLPVPKAEFINTVLKPSPEQTELVESFAERAEKVRSGSVDPRTDNMLKITNDGRKCALDQRLINPLMPDAETSKVNACVDNVYRIWNEGVSEKTTQLIFCDLSTPKSDGTFNVYSDVRDKLMARGIPAEEIAFIHDADTETKKAELFAKVRSGQVRVLLGSTPKLGAGTNIQDRLIALHHLDAPWKPSDLEQQEGRILRQGNMNPEVQIYRYVTEGTFDAYMWQLLENKQKFISQIMTSKSPVRACEDVDDTALSYAEIKALATGNPYIKEKMDLDVRVSKLKMLKAAHVSQQYRLESDIARTYPTQIAAMQQRMQNLSADIETAKPIMAQDKDHFVMTVSEKAYTERKDAGAALIKACTVTKGLNTEIPVGEYGAFQLMGSYNLLTSQYLVTLHGQGNYSVELGADPSGNITRINNALDALPKRLEEAMLKLENLQQQMENAKHEVGKPFPQEQELQEKTTRLGELNSLLNMDEHSSEAALLDDESSVSETEPDAPSQESTTTARKRACEEVL